MKIHFYLRYRTQYGQSLFISFGDDDTLTSMEYVDDEFWGATVDLGKKIPPSLVYRYHFRDRDGQSRTEWGNDRRIDFGGVKTSNVQVMDSWNWAGSVENAFLTQPFREILLKQEATSAAKLPARYTHIFKIKAPLLKKYEVVCLLGHGIGLRNWDTAAPVLLQPEGNWWTVRLDLSHDDFPLGYKYGVWNTQTNKFVGFEDGSNRSLYSTPQTADGQKRILILHDGFIRLPNDTWRGAGVAIPVFSIRTANSFGVGEFTEIPALADWGHAVGLKLLQLLPVNDTSATGTWMDSYPYAAISAFALHPIYLNVHQVAGKKYAALLKPYAKKQAALNKLAAVDYESVMQQKWEIFRLLYEAMKAEWSQDAAYTTYYEENKQWLAPYAAFCYLRDKNKTIDFNDWSSHKTYDAAAVDKLLAPNAPMHDEVAIHIFIQWHLHLQLSAATQYAHSLGMVMKGDIPIGIYRYSCDAWVAPQLYNMDQQAGAPPDDFAVKGQNWGFPTYNWERMKEDGFAWWKHRFAQMKAYFDAFRIDHILGFFRIWSIPLDAVEGILGHFVPAIPVTEREFLDAGIGFNYDRLCKPYITDQVLSDAFGDLADTARENFVEKLPDEGHWTGSSRYALRPALNTQRAVTAFFATEPDSAVNQRLQAGLFDLISNVILIKDPQARGFHFRIGMESTSSFQTLPEDVRSKIRALYVDYFYRRQDDFWQLVAMEKLPALKRSTDMLICGEDLGMVPGCVPDVMRDLGILSLEIQRMPKKTGVTFFNPKDAPYLAVVTPSTHDMSTIRGWWEENPELSRRFFREELGLAGDVPFFCEPWLNQAILAQHFQSPAMWAIFQIQDLLGMDGKLRRENPNDERINVPANPKHYWQYRMHLSVEDLKQAAAFNKTLKEMIEAGGR
jgi:4-alpha-glucanotransferase